MTGTWGERSKAALATLVAAIALVLVGATAAHAVDTVVVDFEASPPAIGQPVEDEYAAATFVSFPAADPGFRPYRTSAPTLARSGSTVADVGASRCVPEGFPPVDCEFAVGGTAGRLSRFASSVKLYAGLFEASGSTVTVRIVAQDVNGAELASGPAVPIAAGGFTTEVAVTSPTPNIARFRVLVEGAGATGASVGFDDLTLEYPEGSLPDVSLSTAPDVVALQQGGSVDVPVGITRLNGSNGNLDMSVSGLPAGVTATAIPDPVPGTGASTIVRLTAAADAATFEQPATITVTGSPDGNAAVAPGARTATFLLRLASPYALAPRGATSAAVPPCAAVEVPFTLQRDRAFTGTVALALENVPANVDATVLPGSTIAPGGGFFVEGAIRLTGTANAPAPGVLRLRATSPGLPDRTLDIAVTAAAQSAALDRPFGLEPRRMQPGTTMRLTGPGFCPGTTLRTGSVSVPLSAEPDGRGATFAIPRGAVTGPVTIDPPGTWPTYQSADALTPESYRGRNGFQFGNYGFSSLSITELTDAFGADDLFIKVNPCWPWGSCSIVTGILNPVAAVNWGALNLILRGTGGHCFGMSLGSQELQTGRKRLNAVGSGSTIFELGSPSGASGLLGSYLDARHAVQGSQEFLYAYVARPRDVASQVDTLRAELQRGRDPIVTIADRTGPTRKGHAMLAYDLTRTATGWDIHVYDSNRPFQPGERTNGGSHLAQENASVIHVEGSTWRFDTGGGEWSGGDNGTLWVVPTDTIPSDPSLPGLTDIPVIAMSAFGSAQDAVRLDAIGEGAEYVPSLDPTVPGGSAGWVLGGGAVTLRGVGNGTYTHMVGGKDFSAAVSDVRTGDGVRDTISADLGDGELTFAGSRSRPLTIDLARGSTAATIGTRTSGGGEETAAIARGGTVSYTHEGGPARFSLRLQKAVANGGVQTFDSGTLRIGRGERVTAKPGAGLRTVRLTVRGAGGKRTTRVLRTKARKGGPRVVLGKPTLRGRTVSVPATVRGLKAGAQQATLGAVLRAGKVRRTLAVTDVAAGRQALRFTLPASARGRLRLRLDARLIVAGPDGASASTARRLARVRR